LKTDEEIDETNWAQVEFAEVDLADGRLNDRIQRLSIALGKQPLAPINAACDDWQIAKRPTVSSIMIR
jgi:hypothetical protein